MLIFCLNFIAETISNGKVRMKNERVIKGHLEK